MSRRRSRVGESRRGAAELVALDPAAAVDIVLHWQQWRLRSPTFDRVREVLLDAAERELDQPGALEISG